jgi:hypothetical protein
MSFKKKFAYVAGTLAVLVLLSGINIALPTTIKVTYAADGKPVPDASVVSYLAIRGGFHNFDGGQSLSRTVKTDAQGNAVFGLDFTWVFLNSFQDYNSRILVYKPNHAPHIAMGAFNLNYALVTYAEPKNLEFNIKPYSLDNAKKRDEMDSVYSQLGRVCTNKEACRELIKAFSAEYH